MEKPSRKRRYITREYDQVAVRLRKLFQIPTEEMIIKFEWNRDSNRLLLTSIIDYNKREGDM